MHVSEKHRKVCLRQEVDVAFHFLCVLSASSWSSLGNRPARSDNTSEAHLFTHWVLIVYSVASGKPRVKKGKRKNKNL